MNPGSVSFKTRAPRPGFRVAYVCADALHVTSRSLPFDCSTPGDDLDRGDKVEAPDPEGGQDLDDVSASDEGTERRVTSPKMKERVAAEITKDKNRQRKYHTKKSAQRSKGGRVRGSKAKNSVQQQVTSADWF